MVTNWAPRWSISRFASSPGFAPCRPVSRETSRCRTINRIAQRTVPLCGPAAYDQAKLIEDAIQKLIELRRISIEFSGGIPDTDVEVIPMHLEDAALRVNQRECALNLIGGTQDRRYNPFIGESGFHETVKIRGQDDSYESFCGQCRDSAVRRSWLFLALVAFPGRSVPNTPGVAVVARLASSQVRREGRSNPLPFRTCSDTKVPGRGRTFPSQSCANLRIKSRVISQPVGIFAALETPEPTRTA